MKKSGFSPNITERLLSVQIYNHTVIMSLAFPSSENGHINKRMFLLYFAATNELRLYFLCICYRKVMPYCFFSTLQIPQESLLHIPKNLLRSEKTRLGRREACSLCLDMKKIEFVP